MPFFEVSDTVLALAKDPMGHDSPLWSQLRGAVIETRVRLDALPYARTLSEGRLPLDVYVSGLRALSVVHAVMESTLDAVEAPPLSTHWSAGLRKGPLLEADLRDLAPSPATSTSWADEEALRVTERVRLRSVRDPLSLIGYLFVLQEYGAGAATTPEALGTLLGLPGPGGLRYLTSFQTGGDGPWAQALEGLAAAAYDAEQRATLVGATDEACQGLLEIFGALFPPREEAPPPLAVGLNPEAGRHPVPTDPREVEAAIVAGRRIRDAFPYFQARYGARGERFTNSDCAWLVTLADHPQETVEGQVRWLCGVLAARGMPRVTLEVSLREIHRALMEAVPEKEAGWGKLLEAADSLRTSRCAFLDDAEQDALARAFHDRVAETGADVAMDGAGRLLVSAVMDELDGVEGAVESLGEWMTDADRFPPAWIVAVQDTLRQARERARPHA